jgi:hypothetical protein
VWGTAVDQPLLKAMIGRLVYNPCGMTLTTKLETQAPAWSVRLAFELSGNDQSAQAVAGGLNEEQINWQPAPGKWSVGQCLEHLCLTNDAYMKAIAEVIKGKPDSPVEQITPGWFARWFIRNFIEPSPQSKKAKTWSKISPGARVDAGVLDRFLAGNRACRELVLRAREKNVNQIRFRNPWVPVIWFTVGTALEIIAGHERRHLLQAERVRDAAGFPR